MIFPHAGAQKFFLTAVFTGCLGTISILPLSAETGKSPVFYVRAEKPAPVLNTADFSSTFGGKDGKTLKRDAQGLVREVEFIALPGTAFMVEASYAMDGFRIYRVRTADYPSPPEGLFVDSRFVATASRPFPPRPQKIPPRKQILDRMVSRQGLPYVWGGNIAEGVPEILKFYPPGGRLSPAIKNMWMLRGLDCSGLLYEASDGATPRNTSDLTRFGKPVPIAGLVPSQIASKLQPLDLIVWKGHVIIVLDRERTIESCMGCSSKSGVTIRKLDAVLKEIMKTRTPMNTYPEKNAPGEKPFVIRRWHHGA